MNGMLSGVGIGPGDPELLTLKALRIIKEADVIAFPKSDVPEMTAFNIVNQVVDLSSKQIMGLYMPMTRDIQLLKLNHEQAVHEITEELRKGKNIAFLTLGDPSIYSTYVYIHKRVLKEGLEAQLIPGVPSFCAAASRLNISLCEGGEPLHIIPASYKGTSECLDWQGTKVLMKSGKKLDKVKEMLKEKGMLECSSMVECCGMVNEKIYTDLNQVKEGISYFSLIIVKDREIEQ